MNIEMKQFGTSLCTRVSGRDAYSLILKALDSHTEEVLVFDFTGVNAITNSFADEVFGRLAAEKGMDTLRETTTFKAVDRSTALLIRTAMERRIRQQSRT